MRVTVMQIRPMGVGVRMGMFHFFMGMVMGMPVLEYETDSEELEDGGEPMYHGQGLSQKTPG